MSNATKPIELQNALTARLVAWQMYDAALEAGKPNDYIAEVVKIVDVCDERVAQLYKEWQSVGGTSDIESLALHPVTEAQQIERAIDATLHAEDLGTRMIISGGDVLELGTTSGHDEDIF